MSIELKEARLGIEAAEAKARELGVPMVVAVVDPGGNLVALERMDDALLVSLTVAANKAYTAVALRMATAELGRLAQPGQPLSACPRRPAAGWRSSAAAAPLAGRRPVAGWGSAAAAWRRTRPAPWPPRSAWPGLAPPARRREGGRGGQRRETGRRTPRGGSRARSQGGGGEGHAPVVANQKAAPARPCSPPTCPCCWPASGGRCGSWTPTPGYRGRWAALRVRAGARRRCLSPGGGRPTGGGGPPRGGGGTGPGGGHGGRDSRESGRPCSWPIGSWSPFGPAQFDLWGLERMGRPGRGGPGINRRLTCWR